MSRSVGKNVQKGRPVIKIDEGMFLSLLHNGLTDQQIAEHLGVSRQTVMRRRQALGVKPNRKRGQRGVGKVRDNKTYYEEVRRVMRVPEIAKAIYRAARQFRNSGGDETTSYIATITDPAPMPAVSNTLWCSRAENINLTQVKYIISVEQRAQQASVAGVPGPAVFKLAENIKTGSKRLLKKLAMEAVVNAFMVGVHETVALVKRELDVVTLSRRTVSAVQRGWEKILTTCLRWAPVQEERKITANTGCGNLCSGSSTRGAGKRGRGGGIQNTHNHRAWQGANGY